MANATFKIFAGDPRTGEGIKIATIAALTPAHALARGFNNSEVGEVARAVGPNTVEVSDRDFLPLEEGKAEHFAVDAGGGVSPVFVVYGGPDCIFGDDPLK
jgi:hypothetical protein